MSRKVVAEFFENSLAEHGTSTRAVGCSPEGQRRRFDLLLSLADYGGKSVLDVGCGLGDLRPRLLAVYPTCRYIGVDIVAGMVAQARQLQPEGDFRHRDVIADGLGEPVDVVVVNGIDNLRTGHNERFARRYIPSLFSQCRAALFVTMLSRLADRHDARSHYFDPLEMLAFALSLTRYATLRHDYALNDFALALYHRPAFCATE